jgi:hypothetical protein
MFSAVTASRCCCTGLHSSSCCNADVWPLGTAVSSNLRPSSGACAAGSLVATAAAAFAMLQLLLLMASCMSPTPVLGGGPCLPYVAAASRVRKTRALCMFEPRFLPTAVDMVKL